ncbi:MAG: hypothetical protein PHW46_02695 [Candidatus Omnitrophica bacterium]|nr:hypothetical protein [Candidatus Omnitrophota bacterium]
MRAYKIILVGILATIIAMAYVHLRVEIFKSAYELHKNSLELARLVDQNSKLMYNLSKLESPKYLLASLDQSEIEFTGKRNKQIGGYKVARSHSVKEESVDGLVAKFLDTFTLSAEAKSR